MQLSKLSMSQSKSNFAVSTDGTKLSVAEAVECTPQTQVANGFGVRFPPGAGFLSSFYTFCSVSLDRAFWSCKDCA